MAKVKVLPVPRTAFNPARPVSTLLKSQIAQLQSAVLEAVDSEQEAAHCVRTLTLLLQDLRPRTAPSKHGPLRKRTRRERKARQRQPVKREAPKRAARARKGR